MRLLNGLLDASLTEEPDCPAEPAGTGAVWDHDTYQHKARGWEKKDPSGSRAHPREEMLAAGRQGYDQSLHRARGPLVMAHWMWPGKEPLIAEGAGNKAAGNKKASAIHTLSSRRGRTRHGWFYELHIYFRCYFFIMSSVRQGLSSSFKTYFGLGSMFYVPQNAIKIVYKIISSVSLRQEWLHCEPNTGNTLQTCG